MGRAGRNAADGADLVIERFRETVMRLTNVALIDFTAADVRFVG